MTNNAKPVETGVFLHPPRRKHPWRQGCCDTCRNLECTDRGEVICWTECLYWEGEKKEERNRDAN